MADDLTALESWLDPLLAKLSRPQRRQFFRRIGMALRRRQADRIKRQQNPEGTRFTPRKEKVQKKAGRIVRRKEMFKKLRQARHLKVAADANGVAVGYNGKDARIAKIHQFGLLSRVMPGGPLFQYPVRRLLGFSDEDRDWLLDEIQKHLSQ
jgi:phage virion morphogenesis protein